MGRLAACPETRHPRSYMFVNDLTLSRIDLHNMLIKGLFGSRGS